MDIDKLKEQSEQNYIKIVNKRRQDAIKEMKKRIKQAAKEGKFSAIVFFIWSEDLKYLQDYFEKEGFYIRKYHFGLPNDNLEVSWGKGAEEDKYYDELQLKWMKEKEEEEEEEREK